MADKNKNSKGITGSGDKKADGNQSSSTMPTISIPKGGGAIRGIGEKFGINPVTGTSSFSVPIYISPGRSNFGPQISLSYDSGSGNGPFGFGWSLSLPSITRKTDKGLPKYQDAIESDEFILSGSEDLVPVFKKDSDGNYIRDAKGKEEFDEYERDGYRVRRYQPRIEGLFALIERWTRKIDNDVHWRSISKDNILTIYGKDEQSRIVDPSDSRRIFSWLICESYDDKGNAIVYEYLAENKKGVNLSKPNERNRSRTANRYLKHIFYGNRKPLLLDITQPGFRKPHTEQTDFSSAKWMFEVVFDYGDHCSASPKLNDYTAKDTTTGLLKYPWKSRSDPFSSYRAGFEIRTYRLCHRVLMFHHFGNEEGVGNDCLVRSTDLFYTEDKSPEQACSPVYTFLKRITQSGYKRDNGGYLKRSLPPVEFEYSQPIVQGAVEEVDRTNLDNLPIGLDGKIYQWIDLHGEGIPGILTEQSGAWFYKRNLSPVNIKIKDGIMQNEPKFGAVELIALKPNLALAASAQFMDLAGDGQPDLVIMDGPTPGLYEHDDHEGWQNFHAFVARLNHDTKDPNLKLVDLDGDGHADVLIAEDDAFVWHVSLAEDGFGPAQRVYQALDEEKGPSLIFSDGTQSIYLADISGDGMTDLVRIRNGEVCYWPNLGYGCFGAKVTMDHSPYFDNPDQFDQKRIRLADIDGTGTTDIIYLHRDGVRLYFNQSGNSWSEPRYLKVFPRVDDLVSIIPIDLLGNGTACLVWSSPLPGDAGRQMHYVNLMGGEKPHLLVKTINNLGAETHIHYAPSTKFYLQDKYDGNPWITRLPFPVHVVESVDTYDHISRNLFVTRYAYHHGYFDGEEREFRGFGMIEQWDTEEFAAFAAFAGGNVPADNIAAASHVPPVHTKTWFHTGIYHGRDRVSRQFEHEYFREPGLTIKTARNLLLDDTIVPPDLTLDEEREACRALKGSMLRQEVYADDAGPDATPEEIKRARTPYTVTEQNFTIRTLQRRGANRHAVFFTHAREAISYHYERNAADPRIQHSLTLEVDGFGNVLKQAAIGYGRHKQIRVVDDQGNVQQVPNPGLIGIEATDQAKQTTPLLTYTENRVTNAIEISDTYRTPLPCEALTFELTGYTPTGATGRFQASDLVEPDPAAAGKLRHKFEDQVSYEAAATGNPCRRPIEWLRTLYRRDDLNGLLPLGELQSLALPGESYKLAFTPGLLEQIFQRPRHGQSAEPLLPDPTAVLGGQAGNRGGYVPSQAIKEDGRFPATDADDHWWIPSGQSYFTTNPSDAAAVELAQALQHFFLPRRYRDPFGQDALVDFDAHDLLMVETRDALGSRVTVEANDYRVLQPRLVSDPNRNQTEVAFDTLGMVAGTAVMGKPLPAPVEGDTLTGFLADITLSQLDRFMAAPRQPSANPKESEATQVVHDLLQGATTRIVYDLERFKRSGEPAFAATIARETHVSSLKEGEKSKLQLSFSYSDGFGRETQKKIQAEPGPLDVHDPQAPIVNPRWVGSGWTIFNNKGKPVRQYEPFFDDTHAFKFAAIHGVSPVLFYDPAERVIATLHPNHTYEKVVFDPWQQTTYDVNDTCSPRNQQTGDPRTDNDIGGYVAEYFKMQPATWQTWHAQRVGGAMGPHERNAAERAAAHADTPTTGHFDALGRPFLTVVRNRVVCPGHDLDGSEDNFSTRVELDIEGNQRIVWHERRLPVDHLPTGAIDQRIVMRYAYDMLGNRIHQISMEAGARWMLSDVAGKPIRAWDSRGHNFTTKYDALRRPMEQTVRGTFSDPDPLKPNSDPRTLSRDILVDKIEYGEGIANAEALNLRTRIYRHFDSAGVATNARFDASGNMTEAYDFKGNLLCSTRQLVSDYKTIPDWLLNPQLDAEIFEGSTRYDALNRPIQSIAPHSSLARPEHPNKFNVIQPVFNEANLLERVDVWLERDAETAVLLDTTNEIPSPVGVANIDYDAKGQRLRIDYKNGASTFYDYDELTFRLTHLYTRRGAAFSEDCDNPTSQPPTIAAPEIQPGGKYCGLQNLHYTYDPAGNITHIQDDAHQTIYFKKRVEPSNDYFYDALYRLIQATGREHLGQTGEPLPHSHDDADRIAQQHPNDGKAMGRYIERYVYDAVGNFLQMQHYGSEPAHAGWRRIYDYSEPSLIEDGSGGASAKISNRLTQTTLHPDSASPHVETYLHDAHGNMVRMPHLGGGLPGPNMHWDYKDQLQQTDLGVGGTAYYVYDATGQRVRKVWEKSPGLTKERIYLGGFEIFRKHGGPIGQNTATLERETLHVMDDKQRIALVETRTLDTAGGDQAPRQLIRYQFGNHLGSASLELDEEAQIISYEEYAPYGSSTYQAVRSQTETAKRYRYTGKERDTESGLYYHGARYYAAWLGRWASCDPIISISPAFCSYQFCSCNPIVFKDDDGKRDDWAIDPNALSFAVPPSNRQPPPPDPLEEAARLHGRTEGRLQTLQQEIVELYESRQRGAPLRFWSMEHFFAAAGFPEPITERGQEAQAYVDAGLAEAGQDDYWHSTVFERAIENGLITNQADQERFLQISEGERRSAVVRWALWRAAEMALALTPVRGAGAGGMLFARAPQSTSVALTALNQAARSSGVSGTYRNVVESMSRRAMQFQELVSGGIRAGTSFVRNGVKFDFLDTARRMLVDAKGPGYANFVNRTTGEFYGWFRGRQTLVDQARRQLAAARGTAVEWVFAEREAMQATQRLLQSEGITGIAMRVH